MKWTDELLKLLFERSEDQMDANPVERFRRQARQRQKDADERSVNVKSSKRAFRKFRIKVTKEAGKTARDVHPQTGKIPESNNNWKDRLSSLMLGEQDDKPKKPNNPLGLSPLKLGLRKLIGHSRSPHSEKSAAGAQGNTQWARSGKPYLRRYGGGENVAHNVGSMASLKSTSTEGVPSDPTTGPLGRRKK